MIRDIHSHLTRNDSAPWMGQGRVDEEIADWRLEEGTEGQELELPEGVTQAEWDFERTHFQDPRLRGLLYCLRLLDDVVVSDKAVLHCSSERLQDIWRKTRSIGDFIVHRLSPLLEEPSPLPLLEEARRSCQVAVRMLANTTLHELNRLPHKVPQEREQEVRKVLCAGMGQLQDFVSDVLRQLILGDPRSDNEARGWFSPGFLQRVDEAACVRSAVAELDAELQELAQMRPPRFVALLEQAEEEVSVPSRGMWEDVVQYVDVLLEHLVPKLKDLVSMPGVRVDEIAALDRYTSEIARASSGLKAVYAVGRDAHDQATAELDRVEEEPEAGRRVLMRVQAVLSQHIVDLMHHIDDRLRDLTAFVPLWLGNLDRRRALDSVHERCRTFAAPGAIPGLLDEL